MTTLASPLKRRGGKAKLAPWIISHLPPHESYVEVFAGSAPVLFRKPRPKDKEVYNDFDRLWHNSLTVVRDHPDELADLLDATLYSRSEYDDCRAKIKAWRRGELQILPVELARCHFVDVRQSVGSDGGWSYCRTDGPSRPRLWARLPNELQRFARRLMGVFIDCQDYKDILRAYDDERTTFYLDPPYCGVEKKYYAVNREEGFDHQALRDAVEPLQASVVVSYYKSDYVINLYKGFEVAEKQVSTKIGDVARQDTEILLIRPSAWARQRWRRPRMVDLFPDIHPQTTDAPGEPLVRLPESAALQQRRCAG